MVFLDKKDIEKILIFSIFVISLTLNIFIPSEDLDPYISISYSRYIYEEHEIPKDHPYLYRDDYNSISNPYLLGYSLFLIPFMVFESLIFITPSIFATLVVYLTIKLGKKLQNESILPAVLVFLSYPFLKMSVDPHPDLFCLTFVLSSCIFLINYFENKKPIYLIFFLFFATYAAITRYYGLLTILFFMLYLILNKKEVLNKSIIIVIILASIVIPLYYLINVEFKEESLLYPVFDPPRESAAENYKEHSWIPWMFEDKPTHALGHLILAFYPFLAILVIARSIIDRELFHVFLIEMGAILVLFPSFGGLDRYLLFILPFLASSCKYKFNKGVFLPSIIIFLSMSIYIAYVRSDTLYDDFYEFKSIGKGNTVMFMEYSQLSYEYRCKTLWASQFYFEDFEKLQTTQNFSEFNSTLQRHGVDYIIIDKSRVVESHIGRYSWYPSESFYNHTKNYKLVEETTHYEIYSMDETA